MNDCRINPSDSESLSLDFIDALLEGGEKQCPECGKIKPAGEFYKTIHQSSGRSSWCKECTRNARRNRYYAQKIERIKKGGRGVTATKRCSKCGEVKPLEEFRRDRSRKLGRFSQWRECERQY